MSSLSVNQAKPSLCQLSEVSDEKAGHGFGVFMIRSVTGGKRGEGGGLGIGVDYRVGPKGRP